MKLKTRHSCTIGGLWLCLVLFVSRVKFTVELKVV